MSRFQKIASPFASAEPDPPQLNFVHGCGEQCSDIHNYSTFFLCKRAPTIALQNLITQLCHKPNFLHQSLGYFSDATQQIEECISRNGSQTRRSAKSTSFINEERTTTSARRHVSSESGNFVFERYDFTARPRLSGPQKCSSPCHIHRLRDRRSSRRAGITRLRRWSPSTKRRHR